MASYYTIRNQVTAPTKVAYLEAAQLMLTQPKKREKGKEGISEGL